MADDPALMPSANPAHAYEIRPAQRSARYRASFRCAAIRSAVGPTPDSGSTVIPAPETRGRKFQRVGVRVCNGQSNFRCAVIGSAVVWRY